MEAIKRIIDVVAESHGITRANILSSTHKQTFSARQMLCYYVLYHYPHLENRLNKILRIESDMSQFYCNTFTKKMLSDSKLKDSIDKLDKEVRIREKKAFIEQVYQRQAEQAKKNNATAKRLFNIEYTLEDEKRILTAIQESNKFMKEHCSCGRQPIEEGMVFPK